MVVKVVVVEVGWFVGWLVDVGAEVITLQPAASSPVAETLAVAVAVIQRDRVLMFGHGR